MGAFSLKKILSKFYGPILSKLLKSVNYLTIIGLMSSISRFKYILGIIFFTVLSVNTIKSALNVLKSKDRLDQVNEEVAMLENQKRQIEEEIEFKKTDEYVEEKARNDLNLIKPGERVYVVKSAEEDRSGNVLSETDTVFSQTEGLEEDGREKNENWYSWYRLFFDN